jgi:hypothetical protein
MSRTKALISILMVLTLIALSGASVWAAPNLQESISGEVKEITIEGDTVLVTLETSDETQSVTVRMSLETAIALVLVDDDGAPIVNIGDNVTIPLSDEIEVIEEDGEEEGEEEEGEEEDGEEEEGEEEDGEEPLTEHPVASALAEYFAETLGLDYETVMGYHEEDGMGFGVIAQACWMSFMLNDPDDLNAPKITPGEILEAKKAHDFSTITLPDDIEETPKNWGQFKKAALGNEKAKKNLGAIMSGRANHEQEQEQEQEQEEEMSATGLSGKGKDKGGKPDTPPGQLKNKDKDKGGGPPAEPPGQVKNKDKGGGKKK